jgi:hypothetical protein
MRKPRSGTGRKALPTETTLGGELDAPGKIMDGLGRLTNKERASSRKTVPSAVQPSNENVATVRHEKLFNFERFD